MLNWALRYTGLAPDSLGSIGPAVSLLSRMTEVNLLSTDPWKAALRGWECPTQQHDVTELLAHTLPSDALATVGSWQARESVCADSPIHDMGSTSPFLSIHVQGFASVQSAMTDGVNRTTGIFCIAYRAS